MRFHAARILDAARLPGAALRAIRERVAPGPAGPGPVVPSLAIRRPVVPRLVGPGLLALGLVACTPAGVAPEVESFAGAVSGATGRAADLPAFAADPQALDLARRRALAAAGAEYVGLGGAACDLAEPALTRPNTPLSETCRPVPRDAAGRSLATRFDPPAAQLAADRVVPVPADAGSRALLRRHEAGLLLDGLGAYADALSELATTGLPAELGRAAADAVGAVSDLHDATLAVAERTDEETPSYDTLGELLDGLVREALEARRYALLKATLEEADRVVRRAAIQLAAIAHEDEAAGLAPLREELREAAWARDAGSVEGLGRIDRAVAALVAADAGAQYRVFLEIGATHAAILESLENPDGAEALREANTRIRALVKAVEAYREARD